MLAQVLVQFLLEVQYEYLRDARPLVQPEILTRPSPLRGQDYREEQQSFDSPSSALLPPFPLGQPPKRLGQLRPISSHLILAIFAAPLP